MGGQYLLQIDFRPSREKTRALVLNSKKDGKWQKEIRPNFDAKRHFHANRPFTVKVLIQPGVFYISMDHQSIGTFHHRMPITSATKLRMDDGPQAVNWLWYQIGRYEG